MKKTAYVFVPIEVEGKTYSIQLEYKYFLYLYMQALESKQDSMTIELSDGEKKYKKELPLKEADKIIIQADTLLTNVVPKNLAPFLKDMNQKMIKKGRAKLPERDSEVEKAFFYLSQHIRNNVFLIGAADVGKTSIALEVIRKIANLECATILKGKRVLRLNVSAIRNLSDEEKGKDRNFISVIDSIIEFLSKNKEKLVIFIDNGLMMYTDIELIKLLHAITNLNIPLISTCDAEYFEEVFLNNPFGGKAYNYVLIEEPEIKTNIKMAYEYAKRLKAYYKVNISKEMVSFIAHTSVMSNSTSCDPGQTIDILEKSFSDAFNNQQKEVTKNNVIKFYHLNDKSIANMPARYRREVAYHEAGHFILHRKCKHASNHLLVRFVSILPANYWAGVNWLEYNYASDDITSKDFYIDQIACDIGGREAQKLVIADNTSGANSDLDHANMRAREGVMRCGLSDIKGLENRAYDYEDYDLIPEDVKKLIDSERNKWIALGTERAKKVIAENKELLTIIAERLLKEDVLTGEELDKICENYEKSKKAEKN